MKSANQELLQKREAEYGAKISLEKQKEKDRSIMALRRKEQEVAKLQGLLTTAREANRRDKAEAAAATEALSERLEARNEDFVTRGLAALDKLKENAEPVARGTELTVREIEAESERSQALIGQLQSQLSGTTAELHAARQHMEVLASQLEVTSAQQGLAGKLVS